MNLRAIFSLSDRKQNRTAAPGCRQPRTTGDLNGNGRSDMVLLNSKGLCGAWLVQPDQTVKWTDLADLKAGHKWTFAGYARFSGSARNNIVLYSKSKNAIGFWTMQNGGITGWQDLTALAKDVTLIGIGDFNGDGVDDLLLRNRNGVVCAYITTTRVFIHLGELADDQIIEGIGDFNGDGVDDILIRGNGCAGLWLLDRAGQLNWSGLDALPAAFTILGVGDFNGDGTDDILLGNDGNIGVWTIANGAITGWMGLGELPAHCMVEAIGDFNGDGTDDILLRAADGMTGALLVKGPEQTEWVEYGCLGTEWTIRPAAL